MNDINSKKKKEVKLGDNNLSFLKIAYQIAFKVN
jgi:hypothetical protein